MTLTRTIYPPEEARQVAMFLETALAPSTSAQIAGEIATCLSVTTSRQRDGIDLKLMADRLLLELSTFPPDIVKTALRSWSREEKWWPTLAEIMTMCRWRLERRQRIYQHLVG